MAAMQSWKIELFVGLIESEDNFMICIMSHSTNNSSAKDSDTDNIEYDCESAKWPDDSPEDDGRIHTVIAEYLMRICKHRRTWA